MSFKFVENRAIRDGSISFSTNVKVHTGLVDWTEIAGSEVTKEASSEPAVWANTNSVGFVTYNVPDKDGWSLAANIISPRQEGYAISELYLETRSKMKNMLVLVFKK